MKKITRRGEMQGLTAFVYGIATVAILLAVVFIMLAEVKWVGIPQGIRDNGSVYYNASHMCDGAWNATYCNGTLSEIPGNWVSTTTVITKLQTIPTWVGIIIVVAMAVLVLSYFQLRKGGSY